MTIKLFLTRIYYLFILSTTLFCYLALLKEHLNISHCYHADKKCVMLEFKWPNIDEVDMHNSIKKYYLSYIEFKQAITGIFHPKTSFFF